MKRICKQCGKEFELTSSEIEFYKGKNLELPKRCKECRDKKKQPNQISNPMPLRGLKMPIITVISVLAVICGFFAWDKPQSSDYDTAPITSELQRNEKNTSSVSDEENTLCFRNSQLLEEHYEKHGMDMGFSSVKEYESAARAVVANSNALHKIEAEDGDDVYYLEDTNEFVIVSTDGYIRTYFCPDGGIDYYNRQ